MKIIGTESKTDTQMKMILHNIPNLVMEMPGDDFYGDLYDDHYYVSKGIDLYYERHPVIGVRYD